MQGGSKVFYHEVGENAGVTVKEAGGRTELRNRKLSLMTKNMMGVVDCTQDWQWYILDEDGWTGFEGDSGCLY